jgi:hypothetical protein
VSSHTPIAGLLDGAETAWVILEIGLAFCLGGLDCALPLLDFLPELGCWVCATAPSYWLRWGLMNILH